MAKMILAQNNDDAAADDDNGDDLKEYENFDDVDVWLLLLLCSI